VRLLPAEQARKKGLEGKIVDWAACSSLAFPKPGDRAKAKEAVRPCFYIYGRRLRWLLDASDIPEVWSSGWPCILSVLKSLFLLPGWLLRE